MNYWGAETFSQIPLSIISKENLRAFHLQSIDQLDPQPLFYKAIQNPRSYERTGVCDNGLLLSGGRLKSAKVMLKQVISNHITLRGQAITGLKALQSETEIPWTGNGLRPYANAEKIGLWQRDLAL